MKTKEGQIIELSWDGGPEFFYIRGHIPLDEAKKIMQDYLDGYDYQAEEPVHRYARWSCDARGEYDHSLMDYDGPGRGRFKITEFKRIW